MDVLRFEFEGELEGRILNILKDSGLNWLATGDLAISTLLDMGINPPYLIYVPNNQLSEWEAYLKSCGAIREGHDPIPSLVLIPESNLDSLADGVHHGVPLVKDDRMLRDANPRYLENVKSKLNADLSKKTA